MIEIIQTIGAGAATLVFLFSVIGWVRCRRDRKTRETNMVAYLKKRREVAPTEFKDRKGWHTAGHLSRRFGFTRDEIYTMAKKSRSHIRCEDNPTSKTWYWYCD